MGCKGKKVFLNQSDAQKKANKLNNDLERPDYRKLYVYHCKRCKKFHLTSKTKFEYKLSSHERRMKDDVKYRKMKIKQMLDELGLKNHNVNS